MSITRKNTSADMHLLDLLQTFLDLPSEIRALIYLQLPLKQLVAMEGLERLKELSKSTNKNKQFKPMGKQYKNFIWQKKVSVHFPIDAIKKDGEIDWRKLFINCYDKNYYYQPNDIFDAIPLPKRIKSLFSYVKEKDANSLMKAFKDGSFFWGDLSIEIVDDTSLRKKIIDSEDQALLDCLYHTLIKDYFALENNNANQQIDLSNKQRDSSVQQQPSLLLSETSTSGVQEETDSVLTKKKAIKQDKLRYTALSWAILCKQPFSTIKRLIEEHETEIIYLSAENFISPLMKSIYVKNFDLAKYLIDELIAKYPLSNQIFIKQKSYYGLNALHILAMKGADEELINKLIANGVNVNSVTGFSSMRRENEFFIKDGYFTPAHCAATTGNVQMIQMLSKKGANLSQTTQNNRTLLHLAVEDGHVEFVKFLLSSPNGVNMAARRADGETALHIAARHGKLEILTALIEQWKKQESGPLPVDKNGNTLMHSAIKGGHIECVKFLFNYDVELCSKTNSRNELPIHLTCKWGKTDIAILLADEVDINTPDDDGNTPLHLAAEYNRVKIVDFLLEKNANTNAINKLLKTPANVADRHLPQAAYLKLLTYIDHMEERVNSNKVYKYGAFGIFSGCLGGHKAKQKLAAARSLKNAFNNRLNLYKWQDNNHKGALNNGELKTIFQELVRNDENQRGNKNQNGWDKLAFKFEKGAGFSR